MNHLCGLSNLDDDAFRAKLADDGREVLDAFRRRYQSVLRHDRESESNDDSDEKKLEEAPSPPSAAPAYEVDPEGLRPSGLRPVDDATLARFLHADRRADGTFDSEASHQRLLAALRFRREYKCDAIVRDLESSDIPAAVQRCHRMRVAIWAGVDRLSRPVVFERLGQFFSSGNATKVSQEEWTTSYLYFLETHFWKMRESAKQSGKAVDRIVYLADFQGVVPSILRGKIWKVVPLLKALVKTVECHYPEIVDHIILFNVPRVASAAYNVVRGFLDPVTAGKIELFAGVPQERFEELIPVDVVPAEYGGGNGMEYPQTCSE